MKRPFLLTIIFGALALFSFSQESGITVKVGAKGLYFEHTVVSKENFYSIGRLYNVHPKHFAAFNGLDMSKGLNLGQVVNIPLSDTNFNHRSAKGIPVYYKSASKQTVGTVSAISKTPANNIRKWNKLAADSIALNSSVIIGYLIASGEVSDVAIIDKPEEAKETKLLPEVKKDTIKETPVKQNEPKAVVVKPEVVKPDAIKPDVVKTEPVKEETFKKTEAGKTGLTGDGYFKNNFTLQAKKYPLTKDVIVTSGIFKTTSGWNDGKYYALLDGVEPGTIIKVINPANSKIVYAKVLGQMNGIHQNQGLNLRISDAAASALVITETEKFIVKLNY